MEKQKVIVTDIQMPFWSMVIFMIKWSIASIPALIILSVCPSGLGCSIGLGAIFTGIGLLPGIEGSV